MYWDEADSLMEYWADYPPTHLLVRHALGYKGNAPGRAGSASTPSRADLEALVAQFGRAG